MKKLDRVNVAAIILTIAGIVLEVIGGVVFSPAVSVGMNTNLSPVMFVGIGTIVVSLICAIAGSVMTEKHELNKKVSTIAIYAAILAIMFAIVFVILTIVWPVLNPTNG